jgi:hypothetical protein
LISLYIPRSTVGNQQCATAVFPPPTWNSSVTSSALISQSVEEETMLGIGYATERLFLHVFPSITTYAEALASSRTI